MTNETLPPLPAEETPSLFDRPLTELLALNVEKTLYLVLILAAFVTRFYDLGARVMSHDESLHTQYAWYLYEGRGFAHSPLMHGPLKFELTAFTYWLLGDNDFTARIPTALMGVAAVGLFYFFRKWLGRAGALVGALMMLISPYMLYYSRYIRDEPYIITWGMLTALCVINYMETRASKYLYGLAAVTALFYATMEASFIYIAIFMLFLGLHVVRELFAVSWPKPELRRPFQVSFAVALGGIVLALAVMLLGREATAATGTAVPLDPNAPPTFNVAAALPTSALMFMGALVAAGGLLAGLYFVLRAFGQELRRFPVLDVLMVFGLFVLPQLTALPVLAMGRDPINYTLPPNADFSTLMTSDAGVTAVVCAVLLMLSLAIGVVWDWQRFVICAAIFYGIYIPLFTTFFTNGGGIATGIVGSLGYWLEQHGVQRGSQPLYYYLVINLPVYEFLPALGALFAGGLWAWRSFTHPPEDKTPMSPSDTLGFPVIGFFAFWAVLAFVGFSYAGEKMPWLTTHIALPLILLAAWGIGQWMDSINWRVFREQQGWLTLIILPITVVAALTTFGTLLGATPPLQGSELPQQQASLAFTSALVMTLLGAGGVYWFGRRLGWETLARLVVLTGFTVLALVTARTAFIAAYVNYDYANEFLVYAHGGRGVKTIMAQIEDISIRTQDGLGVKVAYDDQWSWPGTWYLRDYTNAVYYAAQPTREQLQDAAVVIAASEHYDKVERLLRNNYYYFEYIRMVWPMQEYFNWENWSDGMPLAPYDCHKPTPTMLPEKKTICDRLAGGLWTNGQYRQALWNIWWNRDYKLYGELTGGNYDLAQWPVTARVRMYVRKDIAAQIWQYGVGPTALTGGAVDDYSEELRRTLAADKLIGGRGQGEGLFFKPRAVTVAADGAVYVADTNNHRIEKFDAEGNFVLAWGSKGSLDTGDAGPGRFNEPWGVGVGPDGSVYVADTWNHRIQRFDADGNFITTWGQFGNDGALTSLWGPRAVAVNAKGQVFVADTGNKRIVVFDANGLPLTSIGMVGYDPGQFDEPVGVALDADGLLYVADTWNQRVQVFAPGDLNEYQFVREWPIIGWDSTSLDNKPYLAVDAQGRVYVSDPENYRILVFDASGKLLTWWGDYGVEATLFTLPMGVAVDTQGRIYVADAGTDEDGNHRLARFPALP